MVWSSQEEVRDGEGMGVRKRERENVRGEGRGKERERQRDWTKRWVGSDPLHVPFHVIFPPCSFSAVAVRLTQSCH